MFWSKGIDKMNQFVQITLVFGSSLGYIISSGTLKGAVIGLAIASGLIFVTEVVTARKQ
jgi:hypothetical protein